MKIDIRIGNWVFKHGVDEPEPQHDHCDDCECDDCVEWRRPAPLPSRRWRLWLWLRKPFVKPLTAEAADKVLREMYNKESFDCLNQTSPLYDWIKARCGGVVE